MSAPSSGPRFHVGDTPLAAGTTVDLPAVAARHVQVLRLQPGDAIRLFDNHGREAAATVLRIGRREVQASVAALAAADDEAGASGTQRRELPLAVTLAVGVPANDRMDALVEKATELGAAAIVPLVCERSVLRLEGDRAARRVAHWQAVAVAACEQCGRSRVPLVSPLLALPAWLRSLDDPAAWAADSPHPARWLLDPRARSMLPQAWAAAAPRRAASVLLLSGPEGGFGPTEEALARTAGFASVGLGSRVLRADTAPLAALAWLALTVAAGDAPSPIGGSGDAA